MHEVIIKRRRVRVAPEAARPIGAAGRAEGACRVEKGVRLLEADGRVHAIELTCSCGEVSVVELDYAAPARAAAPAQTPDAAAPGAQEPAS